MMRVYFAQAGAGGPVKIGVTNSVAIRRDAIQSSHHEPISILRELPGDRQMELNFHVVFRKRWLRGEWFSFDPLMLDAAPVEPPAAEIDEWRRMKIAANPPTKKTPSEPWPAVNPTTELITAFARVLAQRGLQPHRYAEIHGMGKRGIYALAGIRAHDSPSFFRTSTLERVSADTGIPATRLYAEAMDALKHEPRLPRRYTRRGNGAAERTDGVDTAGGEPVAD